MTDHPCPLSAAEWLVIIATIDAHPSPRSRSGTCRSEGESPHGPAPPHHEGDPR